ncbi:MAG: GTPase [Planctomycetota bacterium]|nr:MAG: GTPase [Planctomycetota bacterium]
MTDSASTEEEETCTEVVLSNGDKANAELKKHIYYSIAAGFIPAPLLDIAAIAGIQLKMIHTLTKIYDIPFSENIGKSAIGSLIGGIGTPIIARSGIASLVKSIPVIGGLVGAVVQPTIAGAATYAVGKVFISHFETGGTLLDFNPEKLNEHFKNLYAEGHAEVKGTVDEVKKEKDA